MCSPIHFSEAKGVVQSESSSTLAGMFYFPRNENNIFTLDLLPQLRSDEVCFD
jgi:hypothetical protein